MSDATARADDGPLIIGRYALFDAVASGGMATVHLARLLGPAGFGRTVAVKRLHAQYTTDPDFVTMFMDEARIVARIRHPNVVPMVDVIESSKGLFLVMEYIHGEAFSKLLRTCRAANEAIPVRLLTAIMHGALLGLHAAHETRDANGELLGVVHRDVSPQNIIVGAEGVARVLDFGVAKAAGRAQVTREGQIKGKLAYMAPEQIRGKVDRRADVFAAAVVLWESLAGRRFHDGAKDVEIVSRVAQGGFRPPSAFRSDIGPDLDAIVMRGLEVDPERRYQTAREMALDLEARIGLALPTEIAQWVQRLAGDVLRYRADKVAAMERASSQLVPSDSMAPPMAEPPMVSSYDHAPRRPSREQTPRGHLRLTPSEASLRSNNGFATTETGVSRGRTPLGTEMPDMPPERQDLAPVIAILSFCGALAVIGIVLGGIALYARSTAAPSALPPGAPTSTTVTGAGAPSDGVVPSSSGQASGRSPIGAGADGGSPAGSASGSSPPPR
ncbi:MAG TPA: serine/threonine-protein kinase [Labilithrix sp.]|nr:serine/threonine-protein kinase [Labilithrix sp.]